MIQLLVFHHKERRLAFRIHPHYKRGGIIEVYAELAGIDKVDRKSHLRVIRVKGISYDEGVKYRHKRVLFKNLPRADRKELRRTGTVNIKSEVFYYAIQGEK